MFFRQVKQFSDNFSYIVGDEASREAAVVDSSYNADELSRILKAENFRLKYIFNTHGHSDHTDCNDELRSMFGAKVIAHKSSRATHDLGVDDGDVVSVGAVRIKVVYTPGHTPDGICLLVDDKILLTGDTLFVGECGRTDMAGGDPRSLYDSFFNKLLKLDDAIAVYPGHDYGPRAFSTIGEERRSNYVLQPRSLEEFVRFMGMP
jgi:glyoxylase-like metal-dependent hydrolase (beta-lactamase superfamily II)